MTDVGVARPSAHGQAMMRTATMLRTAYVNDGAGPKNHQARKVRKAIPITAGTKYEAMTSASRAIGGLDPCAPSTRRTICASIVSRPTRVARNVKVPVLLSVAPITVSPACFSTGIDSPVTLDSATDERPDPTGAQPGAF